MCALIGGHALSGAQVVSMIAFNFLSVPAFSGCPSPSSTHLAAKTTISCRLCSRWIVRCMADLGCPAAPLLHQM